MDKQPNFTYCTLEQLTEATAKAISQWEYPPPYSAYSMKGLDDDYLMDASTWGTEQFCLISGDQIIAQVSCQLDDGCLWVGWSMAPSLCGKGNGAAFVTTCIEKLRTKTQHSGAFLLRVAAWNIRAIKAYEKAGFRYQETILDEIAYSNHMEDFWIMKLD